MRVLVTGATGYIGGAAAQALKRAGHDVAGLARSDASADRLAHNGLGSVAGDFTDHQSLATAVGGFDAIVSTASTGSTAGDAETFAKDRDAIRAILAAIDGTGKTLIFTSGSAIFGIFGNGEKTDTVFDEDAQLPLAPEVFAPPAANVHPMIVAGFGAAMVARAETEQAVTGASGIRGIVVRPGLVYGNGGSYDIPQLIKVAAQREAAPHMGAGNSVQGYVHIDDLGDLFQLAVDRAPASANLHGVTAEVGLGDLARAISRMIGVGDLTEALTLEQMFQEVGPVGVSMSLNKRLSSAKTRSLLGWAPTRTDILQDLESGSYAR